jgi:hypothetical protein
VHPTSVSASASDDGAAALAPTTVRVDIVRRLQEHSDTKEWHGVQQMMVVALGAMTYADGAEWGPEHAGDLQAVQGKKGDT